MTLDSQTLPRLTHIVLKLSALPFFPGEDAARFSITETLASMCESLAQADWVVRRALVLWTRWESPRELRALYCSRFRPVDGIEAPSALYLDGVPGERPAPAQKLLEPGDGQGEGFADLSARLQEILHRQKMPAANKKPPLPKVEEINALKERQRQNQEWGKDKR